VSWSKVVDTTPEKLAADLHPSSTPDEGDFSFAEAMEQYEQARRAVKRIVDGGAVGSGPIRVILSGHANEGHEQPGRRGTDRAPDRVTISIMRMEAADG